MTSVLKWRPSNIFFEYFLARYYVNANVDVIKKELFLSSGRLNIKYINVVGLLLVLLDKESKKYTFFSKKLANESYAFIVLTDFAILSDEERWNYYLRIYNEFNSKKEIIRKIRLEISEIEHRQITKKINKA